MANQRMHSFCSGVSKKGRSDPWQSSLTISHLKEFPDLGVSPQEFPESLFRTILGKIPGVHRTRFWRWLNWLLPAALVVLIFTLPRQQDLDRYATADEPMYIREAGGFYTALHERAFDQTNRVIQPGVPTLWMGALAFYRLYPSYAAPGNLSISDFQLWTKLNKVQMTLMQLLVLGRLHNLRLLAAAALLAFLYTRRVFGLLPALVGFWLIAFDPFLFAHSQLLATDAPLATFLLVCLLALVRYFQTHRSIHMLVAGIFAGLAALSKITGVLILPFAIFIWLLGEIQPSSSARRPWQRILPISVMLVAFAATTVLVWPALWSDASQTISHLIRFSLQSASGEINSNSFFLGKMIPNGDLGGLRYASYYPLSFLWRATPVVLVGLIWLALIWKSFPRDEFSHGKIPLGLLLVFAVFFVLQLTLSVKKMDRYLLPVYPIASLAAGIGWVWLVKVLWNSRLTRIRKPLASILLTTALAGQFISVQGAMPYPISYYNSLLGGAPAASQVLLTGWGEGLDQAAAYLNSQPNPKTLRVYSWYAAALNLQFLGRADDLPISGPIDDALFARILASDYTVIYYHQWQRRTSARLLDYLVDKPYVFSAYVHGLEVVRVYDLKLVR
jgi:hypothetical protein